MGLLVAPCSIAGPSASTFDLSPHPITSCHPIPSHPYPTQSTPCIPPGSASRPPFGHRRGPWLVSGGGSIRILRATRTIVRAWYTTSTPAALFSVSWELLSAVRVASTFHGSNNSALGTPCISPCAGPIRANPAASLGPTLPRMLTVANYGTERLTLGSTRYGIGVCMLCTEYCTLQSQVFICYLYGARCRG